MTGRRGIQSDLSLRLRLRLPETVSEVAAILAASCNWSDAAGRLGVTYRTLCRWREPGGLLQKAGISARIGHHDTKVIGASE